jgi:hypothetical protein
MAGGIPRAVRLIASSGLLALFQGRSQIMLAFSIRHAREEAGAIDAARPRHVSTCSVGTRRRRNVPAVAA